ncbi:MAG TPA: hypothetical protein VLI05_06745 [Candidatus Saccharimonadia bacterium]|nr:hypothetical protein [Candidatus Saccharimonadia bacterium]
MSTPGKSDNVLDTLFNFLGRTAQASGLPNLGTTAGATPADDQPDTATDPDDQPAS